MEENHKEEEPSIPSTPEKTPKKRTLTPWERNALKEEKERRARELKALRYLTQAAPGSIPVSQAMKANVHDDDDDDEINVHAGVDEATIDSLYHGRIETPARRSSTRRVYESPNRSNNVRNPNNRYRRNEPPVYYHPAANNSNSVPSSADFPPLGTESVEMPSDLTEHIVTVPDTIVHEPEVVVNPPPSVPQPPAVDDDEMTAFFMQ